jgi:uncharacterized protein
MELGRRDFLRISAVAAAGLSLAPGSETIEKRNGMPYRVLGKTGELVSLLCVGGSHIGIYNVSEEEAIAIVRTALDEGVNFLDNSWDYHEGRSEERMGKALKDGYRDKAFLMTKFDGENREDAQQHLEDSLRRLGVDTIDLWQFHECIRPEQPERVYTEGALEFALEAREQGKIRYIGFTGHFQPHLLAEMIERGFDWDTIQMPLNCFDHHFRSFEKEVLPKALDKNLGVIAMKTLGGSPGELPHRSGAVTREECLRYAMSLPVSTVCSGDGIRRAGQAKRGRGQGLYAPVRRGKGKPARARSARRRRRQIRTLQNPLAPRVSG